MVKFFKNMWYDFWFSMKEFFIDPANWKLVARFLLNLFVGLPLLLIIAIPYLLFMAIMSAFAVQESWD